MHHSILYIIYIISHHIISYIIGHSSVVPELKHRLIVNAPAMTINKDIPRAVKLRLDWILKVFLVYELLNFTFYSWRNGIVEQYQYLLWY